MKKIIILLLLIYNITFYSTAQDPSIVTCKANFSYYILDTFVSSYPYIHVQFYDSTIDNVTSWTWSVNDSIFSHEQNPVCAFLIDTNMKCKGTKCIPDYNVCLKITTSDNCQSTYCEIINLYWNPVPQCQVSFNYYAVPIDSIVIPAIYLIDSYKPVQFYGISQNNVVRWHWDFGDSTYSDLQNPIHPFILDSLWRNAKCGKKNTNCIPSYYVCLTITTSDSCQSSYCDYVYPTITPVPGCTANFSYDVLESNPPQYNFINESDWDGGTVLWSFGDGTFSYEDNPTHIFPTIGTPPDSIIVPPIDSIMHPAISMPIYRSVYTVCLTITSKSGCVNTYCQDIYVQPADSNLCNNFIKLTTTSILGSNYCDGSAKAELIDESGNPLIVKHYLWSTGSESAEIFNLCSNMTYFVSLTNASGCVTAGSFSISGFSSPWYIQYQKDSSDYTFEYLNYNQDYNYEWNFCDGSVESGYYIPDKKIISSNSCWVEVVVKDSSGTEISREKIYLDNSVTKINTDQLANKIFLYPVPPANDLNIRFKNPVNGNFEVSISDILGRTQIKQILQDNNISINIGQLPKGTYICSVKAGSFIMTAKFIK